MIFRVMPFPVPASSYTFISLFFDKNQIAFFRRLPKARQNFSRVVSKSI